MKWIIDNWYLIVTLIAVVVVVCIGLKKWFDKPTEAQIKNIKEWLLFAVTKAEASLGGGTGKLKLRMVYDMAIDKFKWVSYIPFDTFSEWVDEALKEMRKMLSTNESINKIVTQLE